MSNSPVSIHPYFKVHAGRLDAAKALLPRFVARTAGEPGMLHYEFTVRDEVVFCREAYRDADAALAHLGNVEALLQEMLGLSDLIRLEFHGPAAELAKLKEPLKALPAEYYEGAA